MRLSGAPHLQIVRHQTFMPFRALTLRAILFLLLATVSSAWADTMSGIVIVVIDGDTVLFKPDSPYRPDAHGIASRAFLKIRLANIDAPEKDQPYGEAAARELSALVLKQRVQLDTVATDVYGRTIALIQLGTMQVNTELVRRGLAWASAYHRQPAMVDMQRDAQHASRGLWRESEPVPPWIWRREHSAVVH
jgi:endonuclease YncB( thermonuclease family)